MKSAFALAAVVGLSSNAVVGNLLNRPVTQTDLMLFQQQMQMDQFRGDAVVRSQEVSDQTYQLQMFLLELKHQKLRLQQNQRR